MKFTTNNYKLLIEQGIFYGDLETMDSKDVYLLRQYVIKHSKLNDIYRKSLLYTGIFYMLIIALNLFNAIFKFENSYIISSIFGLTTLIFIVCTYLVSKSNDFFYNLENIDMLIKLSSNGVKSRLDNYTKSVEREKNIDSILDK